MAESANYTSIPPLETTIEDSTGALWTLRLSDRSVLRNGTPTGIINVMQIWYLSGSVYAFKGTHWRKWSASKWNPVSWEVMLGTFRIMPDGTMVETAPLMSTTYGLRMAVGRQTLTSHAGVAISAGANIQAVVDANPPGTTYVLAAGTYDDQTVVPKNNDYFIGLHNGTIGVTMDGSGTTAWAFHGYASHVVIRNIKCTNYIPAYQHGMVEIIGPYLITQNCEFSDVPEGGGAGIFLFAYGLVIGCKIENNGQQGYCVHGDTLGYLDIEGVCLDSNEIGLNNPANIQQPGSEQGGGKALFSHHMSFWYNYANNNNGSNFWMDANNSDTSFFANEIYGGWNGIEDEISYNCLIKYNHFNNCWPYGNLGSGFFSEAAIFGGNMSGITEGPRKGIVEISHNTIIVSEFGRAIALRVQNRTRIDNPLHGEVGARRLTRRIYVHHNTIDWSGTDPTVVGQVGLVSDTGSDLIFWSIPVLDGGDRPYFDYNDYTVGLLYTQFAWDNGLIPFAVWQSYGHDIHGSETHDPQPLEWSTVEKNAYITISGSGLVATDTSGADQGHSGRAWADLTAIEAGDKKIWVIAVTAVGSFSTATGIGVCSALYNVGDAHFLGEDTYSVGYYDSGAVYHEFTAQTSLSSFTTGDEIVVCCHGGNKVWFGKNAVPNVTTGGYDISAAGTVFPAYTLKGGAVITAEFATTTGYTPPAGYSDYTP